LVDSVCWQEQQVLVDSQQTIAHFEFMEPKLAVTVKVIALMAGQQERLVL
jgi:hypothetical protein